MDLGTTGHEGAQPGTVGRADSGLVAGRVLQVQLTFLPPAPHLNRHLLIGRLTSLLMLMTML